MQDATEVSGRVDRVACDALAVIAGTTLATPVTWAVAVVAEWILSFVFGAG